MTTTVGSETEADLVNHWLDTGGIPVIGHDGSKVYPRRADLRRAEARASARRRSHSLPADSRRSPAIAAHERPQIPLAAPRGGAFRSTPALADPTPEWGLDLTRPQTAPAECVDAQRAGHFSGTATRLLVMALVVGAEGAAVAQFAGPTDTDNGPTTATFSLEDLRDTAEAERRAAALRQVQTAEAERRKTTAVALESVKEASPAKAEAALDQAHKAKAAQIRHLKAQAKAKAAARAEAAEAAEARKKAQAAERPAETTAPTRAAAKPAPKKAKPAAKPPAKPTVRSSPKAEKPKAEKPKAEKKKASTSSRKKALANARKNPRAAAKVLLGDRGWSSRQYTCLDSLWNRESNWNYRAKNPSSGAYGIPQALPATKMSSAGSDWKTNPVTQIRWGLDYIADRYGSPCGAWSHSESHGWY
ncbi:lytic transglycosylase domain-containing protein [Kineosporia rhizophila]|uniref:lytic transglycosylase domain-containing protein n=1 Tax=Kineosporia rhizophila TaxID=84633 RepID=UPI001E4878F1|nr:lytic transglycosylase domain-containing protein [Kineosporia rhizophila]MCE0540300.1 lytic transglycosylase domain-containing protein [Kineosporia rhizophila]